MEHEKSICEWHLLCGKKRIQCGSPELLTRMNSALSPPQMFVLWYTILIAVVEAPPPDSKAVAIERERMLVAFRLLQTVQLEVICLEGPVTPSQRRICWDVSHLEIWREDLRMLTGSLSRPLGPRDVLLKLP